MKFIQIIEFRTSRIDEVDALRQQWLSDTEGVRLALRGTITRDRDTADTYLNIVEFESYESAMENSSLPSTSAFAAKMAELCDGPAIFRNLDVLDSVEM